MGIKVTHESFVDKLNSRYPNRSYKIIDKYVKVFTKILVENEYGKCLMTPDSLLAGSIPIIASAVDKTQYSINQSKKIHNDRYNYSKYVYLSAHKKSTIICYIHGEFEQTPNHHINGYGCPKCSDNVKASLSIIINKSNKIHKDKNFDYSKAIYKGAHKSIEIICPEHGSFWQSPTNHRKGSGCPKCNNLFNKGFDKSSFIKNSKGKECTFYIIKCFNENEEFYKIGITNRATKKRYSTKRSMPYSYEIIKEIKGEAGEIFDLEKNNKKELKSLKYNPKIKFPGYTECFSKIN